MNRVCTSLLVGAISASLYSVSATAEEHSSIVEALKAGDTKLHLRLRYEDVDVEDLESSSALTLKTRLTYTSGMFKGFGLGLEMDDTTAITDEDYTNGVTPVPGTSPIADPEVTEVNQAYINYQFGKVSGKWGRQRILLDNQRFVGGVGWRQDEQTYSGLTINAKPIEGLSLFYGYITQVNRIFAEAGDHNHDSHLANASYKTPFGTVKGYGYFIDISNAAALSSDTIGLRWEGKAGDYFSYNLEYASQSDAGDNPTEYDADYTLIEGIGKIPTGGNAVTIKAGFEVLGSDEGTTAFKTPLATLHAFQGWTDKFLATPANGVEDMYVSAGSKFGPVNVTLVYHTFSANEGDRDFGNEVGFVVGTKVGGIGLTLKYADYSGDDDASNDGLTKDTSKLWLMAAATF